MHTKFIVYFFLVFVCPLFVSLTISFSVYFSLCLTISLSDCTQETTCQPAGALGLQPRKHCLVSTGGFVSLLAAWFGLVRHVGVWGEFLERGVWLVLLAGLILCKVWKGLVSYVVFCVSNFKYLHSLATLAVSLVVFVWLNPNVHPEKLEKRWLFCLSLITSLSLSLVLIYVCKMPV